MVKWIETTGRSEEDAISAAADFGIRAERAVRFKADGAGVKLNYATVSAAVSEMRVSGCVSDDWAAEIECDFKKRGYGRTDMSRIDFQNITCPRCGRDHRR